MTLMNMLFNLSAGSNFKIVVSKTLLVTYKVRIAGDQDMS